MRSIPVLRIRELSEGRLAARSATAASAAHFLLLPALMFFSLDAPEAKLRWAAILTMVVGTPVGVWFLLRSETLSVAAGRVRFRVRVAGVSLMRAETTIGSLVGVEIRHEISHDQYSREEFYAVELTTAGSDLPSSLTLFRGKDLGDAVAEAQRVSDALAVPANLDPVSD